jgi:MoaA/NifB/PqqE/SkfB family radical SAM enzyme
MGAVMSLYSQLKVAWHPDRLVQIQEGKRPTPIHVQLILSDLCNQDCGFCAYRMSAGLSRELFGSPETRQTRNPNRMIPTAKAMEIVEDCAEMGVKAMQFTGGGEPTVHPDHLQVFARAQRLGMATALVTNGVRLRADDPAIRDMAWVRVSVDAGDAATYAAVRRVPEGHWAAAWRNIETLGRDFAGVLGVGFVVTPENYRGIASAARLARDAGAANMRVGAVFSSEGLGYYGDHLPAIWEAVEEAKAVSGDGFQVIDLFGRRIGDLEEGSPDDPTCNYQYLTVYIGGDLSVYRCCNTAYTRLGTVGSLKDQRFRDAVLDYLPFDARNCTACQFIGQNRAIKALTEPPMHAEFV